MGVQLKGLGEQVVVITGASSGIGLATARMAARRGARVVLAARNEDALRGAVEQIVREGGRAHAVTADVAEPQDMERLAAEAVQAFGGIDTWVNNASVAIYGRLDEVPLEDKRRLFDVNFWGVVHGCRAALPHLRARGGALINIGSLVSDQAVPLLGIYDAAKHAVKGYTDTLRMELEEEGAPVSVTLVKPSSINTPFFDHAKNYMEGTPKPIPPVYAPEVVAEVILHCAEQRVREIQVGGGGKMLSAMGTVSQGLTERYLEATAFQQQQDDRPKLSRDNLYAPAEMDGVVNGSYRGHVMKSSLYTSLALRPLTVALAAVGVGLVIAGVGATRRRGAAAAADAGGAATDGGIPDSAEAALHAPAR